ncbi:MAG: hypothetical protein WKF92_02095 [Pyrinomonadaceae bacterium]
MAYWIVFEAAHLIEGFGRDQMMESNFDGYTGNTTRYEFGFEILVLLVFGTIIGSVIGYVFVKIFGVPTKKLA